MTKSFNQWIREQAKRNDKVGDLARDILNDDCWPKKGKLKSTFINHLRYEHEASEKVLATFNKAFEEWEETEAQSNRQFFQEGGQFPLKLIKEA